MMHAGLSSFVGLVVMRRSDGRLVFIERCEQLIINQVAVSIKLLVFSLQSKKIYSFSPDQDLHENQSIRVDPWR